MHKKLESFWVSDIIGSMYCFKTYFLLTLALLASSCGGYNFDFLPAGATDTETQTDTETEIPQCDEFQIAPLVCSPQIQGVSLTPETLVSSVGCAPKGLNFAALSWPAGCVDNADLFAWLPKEQGEATGELDDESYLAFFQDQCGEEPVGILSCDFRPWLVEERLGSAEEGSLYLHVFSNDTDDLWVNYQVVPEGEWETDNLTTSPTADDGLECALEMVNWSNGLLDTFPWPDDFTDVPPAALSTGESWLCGEDGLYWRQMAYPLWHDDPSFSVTMKNLVIKDPQGNPLPFNYGIFECSAGGAGESRIKGDDVPAQSGCGVFEAVFDRPVPQINTCALETISVLILQVPPSVGPATLELETDTDSDVNFDTEIDTVCN